MSFLWTRRVDRSLLKPGDHIYCYRKVHFYTHHGIYIGDNKVIHLTRPHDDRKSFGSFFSSLSSNKNCKECNGRENNNPTKLVGGVVECCVDCFVKGRHGLHLFEYGVSSSHLKRSRAGTCSISPARYSPEETVRRAKEALVLGPQGFGKYNLFNNNCEAFAVYCKTGHGVSLQALKAKIAFQDLTSKPFSLKSLGRTVFDLVFTKKFNPLQHHVEEHRRGHDGGPKYLQTQSERLEREIFSTKHNMDFRVIVVFAAGLLGLLSCGTGFGAEVTRIKKADIEALSKTSCVYPESTAKVLGLTAATTLLVAHIIINVASGCFCCRRNGRSTTQLRFLCVLSWVAFFIAMRMLLAGTALNDGMVNGNDRQIVSRLHYMLLCEAGVFAGGAFLSALSVMLGIMYYRAVTKDDPLAVSGVDQGGIPMAQPQFLPTTTLRTTQPRFLTTLT